MYHCIMQSDFTLHNLLLILIDLILVCIHTSHMSVCVRASVCDILVYINYIYIYFSSL